MIVGMVTSCYPGDTGAYQKGNDFIFHDIDT